jgi:hypothetical protein
MTDKKIKLYRGITADEFIFASDDLVKKNKKMWAQLLSKRAEEDFRYPREMDNAIVELHANLRLEYQYFTDSKSIAYAYAHKARGILLEMTVPVSEIAKHFDLEFQNFSSRKKRFEIVYRVKGSVLKKFNKTWKLKMTRSASGKAEANPWFSKEEFLKHLNRSL